MKLPSDFDYFPSSVLCNEGTLSMKARILVPSPPGICISGFPSVKEKRGGKCGNNLYPSQASPVGPETPFPQTLGAASQPLSAERLSESLLMDDTNG